MSGLDLWPWNGSTVRTTPVAEPRFVVFTRREVPGAGYTDVKCIGVHSTRADLVNHVQSLDLTDDDVRMIFAEGNTFEHGTERFFHTVDDE